MGLDLTLQRLDSTLRMAVMRELPASPRDTDVETEHIRIFDVRGHDGTLFKVSIVQVMNDDGTPFNWRP